MIKSLSLKNWTSHTNTNLTFTKGVNLFIGIIGSGKTSVLEAISYALFGKIPGGSRKREKKNEIIRYGEDKAEVKMEFELDGKNYTIIRSIHNSKSEAELYIDDLLAEKGVSRVNEYIEKKIGLDYKTFVNILFSAQNELDKILVMESSKRKEIMDKMMGIEEMSNVMDKATKIINKLKTRKRALNSIFDENEISILDKEIEKTKEDIAKLTNEEIEKQKVLEEYKQKYENINKIYKNLLKTKKEFEELNKELNKMKGIVELYKDVKKIDEDVDKEIEIWKNKKENMKNKEEEINNNIKIIYSNIITIERELKERENINKEISKLEKEIIIDNENYKDKIDKLKRELYENQNEIKRAKHNIEELKKASSQCPLCLSPLNENRKNELINMLSLSLKDREKENNLILSKLKILEEKYKNQQKQEKTNEHIKGKIENLKKKLKIEIKDKEPLIKQKVKLTNELERTKKELNDIEQTLQKLIIKKKEIEENNKRFNMKKRAEENIKRIKEMLNNIVYDEEKFKHIIEERNNIVGNYNKYVEQWKSIKKEIEHLNTKKEEMIKKLNKLKKIKSTIEKIETLEVDLTIFKEGLITLQQIIRNELIESLNKTLPELWTALYPYNDYKTVKIKVDKDGYSFYGLINDRWVNLASFASGGERTTFSIALRIAITNLLLPKLNILILDEPTQNLDDYVIDKFIQLIDEQLNKFIKQTFIITHDERLKNVNNGTVFLFKRNKDTADPTRVEIETYNST